MINQILQQKRGELSTLFNRKLGIPALQLIHKQKSLLQTIKDGMHRVSMHRMEQEKHKLSLLAKELSLQNPVHMMTKGYSKIEHNGVTVHSVNQLDTGNTISFTLADGTVSADVKTIKKHKPL